MFRVAPASSVWRASPLPTSSSTGSERTAETTPAASINRDRGLFICLGITICLELAIIAGLISLGQRLWKTSRQQQHHDVEGSYKARGIWEEVQVPPQLGEIFTGTQASQGYTQPSELGEVGLVRELPNH